MRDARTLDATAVRAGTPWPALLDAIADVVGSGAASAPDRHVHDLVLPDGSTGSLLIMPSWVPGDVVGVKTVTYVPTNAGTTVPTVHAVYLLFDGGDGRVRAILDGDELTARRTAAISVLAATRLARPGARRLLVVGTGSLSTRFVSAYVEMFELELVEIWGRRADAADAAVAALARGRCPVRRVDDLRAAVAAADIVSCVTGSTEPLVHGADLAPGTHVDLVGGFRADMRESDDAAVERARLFVDTRPGALAAGDLAQPLAAGVIEDSDIRADLADLVTGRHAGRAAPDEITLFKSAGFALADLAAARLALSGQPAARSPASDGSTVSALDAGS